MVKDESSWCTIESDPGVFTELIEKIGVAGVQVEEIWSMDMASLMQLSPIYGLVFLFKWEKEQHAKRKQEQAASPDADAHQGVFFAQQVIPNACATQAILSILLNIPPGTPGVNLGTELSAFRDFTAELPSDMKGLAINNSDLIRTVHNSLARPESLVPDEDEKDQKGGEAFHFVAYLPVDGKLYELDGLQQGPIQLAAGVDTEARWLEAVVPHISARMEAYAAGEVRFNLLALVADRRRVLQDKLVACQQQLDALQQQNDAEGMLGHVQQEISSLEEQLAAEHAKRHTWAEENVRRRHNYIPLMFNLLRAIANEGKLGPFIAAAKDTKKAKTGA